MASPQAENGHTRIANELLEQLVTINYPSAAIMRVLFYIYRCSYGYSKKDCILSITRIQKQVGISKNCVINSLQWLVGCELIIKGNSSQNGTLYTIQKDYEKWVVLQRGSPTARYTNLSDYSSPTASTTVVLQRAPIKTKYKQSINNTVANATPTPTIRIGKETHNMEELEYIPEGKPIKSKSKYGQRTMAILVRKFAECAGIEIRGTFDAGQWSKPLAAILKYHDGDADRAMAFMERSTGYFEEKNLSYTPHTLSRNLPLIDKWISEQQEKTDKKFNNGLYE